MRSSKTLGALVSAAMLITAPAALAEEKTSFKVAWSIYVGWMPWGYLETSGIMDKWAEKNGIDVEIVQVNDYVESIIQYAAGEFDGVTATNMDTLSISSGGGVDTTALIVGDYSNGNDAVILKGEGGLADLEGQARSTWSNCRCRITCLRGGSTASVCPRGRSRRASSTPRTPT